MQNADDNKLDSSSLKSQQKKLNVKLLSIGKIARGCS